MGRKKEGILHMHCVIGRLYVIWRLTLYKSSNYGNIYRNKQPRKTIQYYFAIYPRINGQVSKDAWRSILAPFFRGFHCESSSSDTEKNAKERTLIGPPPSIIEGDVKNRSSTSCAIGVVLHRREKIYFIGKVSSTALKAQKPFSPSAIPNHPRNSKNASDIPKKLRARNIYIMRVKKSFTLY